MSYTANKVLLPFDLVTLTFDQPKWVGDKAFIQGTYILRYAIQLHWQHPQKGDQQTNRQTDRQADRHHLPLVKQVFFNAR